MGSKSWAVELDGRRHEIVLRHGYFSARRQVFVDGSPVLDIRPDPFNAVRLWNTATEHPLTIAGHEGLIRIDPTVDNMTYKKQLIIDGRDVDSGAGHTPLPVSGAARRDGAWLAGYGGLLMQPFAFASLVLGQLAADRHDGPFWFLAGFAGAAVCWSAHRMVGESNIRKGLLGAAVVAALFIATQI